jgi:hypothetical protein
VYPINALEQQGNYLIPPPYAPEYALVTMNGLALTPNDDYQIGLAPLTYYGMTFPVTMLTIDNQTNGMLVATLFCATPAKSTSIWLSSTRTPAFLRMVPIASDAGPLTGVPVNGPDIVRPLLSMNDSFEQLTWNPMNSGVLAEDCVLGASTLVVNLFTQPMSAKLTATAQPLPLPNTVLNTPGAIWIDTERIEYFEYSEIGTQVTLGQLRRGTRGTSFGVQRVVQSFIADGSPTTYTIANLGLVDVLINHKAVPSSLYSVIAGSDTQVTIRTTAGAMIIIGVTTNATHLAGATVYANQTYDPIAAYPSGRAPGPVTGLMAIGTATPNSFVVQWQMPQYGQGVFTYDVGYRVTTSVAFLPVATNIGLTTLVIGGLQPGHSYDVQVISVDIYGMRGPATILSPVLTGVLSALGDTTMSPLDSSTQISFSNNFLTVSS